MSVSTEKWLTGLLGHEPVVTRVTRRVWKNKPRHVYEKYTRPLPSLSFDIPSLDAPRESVVEGHCTLSSYRLHYQSFSEMQPTDLGTLLYSL